LKRNAGSYIAETARWDLQTGMDFAGEERLIRQILVRYYLVWVVYSLAGAFLFGVYPLFLASRGLTQLQINIVLATYFVVSFSTDGATGAFCDAAGRRRGFVIGCSLRIAAFATYFLAHSFALFIVAEAIDGIGTTFANGTIDSWAVDRLDEAGFGDRKDAIFARSTQFANLNFMLGALIGGYVANRDIAMPWLLGCAGYAIAAMVGFAALSGESKAPSTIAIVSALREVPRRLADGIRSGVSSREILLLSIASAIMAGLWMPIAVEWPAYFESAIGSGIWVVGWIFATLMIGRIAGAQLVIRFGPEQKHRGRILIISAAGLATTMMVAAMNAPRTIVVLACLFVFNLFSGISQPLLQAWFNELVEARNRALMLSFQTSFVTLGSAICLIGNGLIVEKWGLMAGWCALGVVAMGAVVCFVALRNRSQSEEQLRDLIATRSPAATTKAP
jgi:MFS family permease